MMLLPVTSWNVLAMGIVPPSRIKSGSVPKTTGEKYVVTSLLPWSFYIIKCATVYIVNLGSRRFFFPLHFLHKKIQQVLSFLSLQQYLKISQKDSVINNIICRAFWEQMSMLRNFFVEKNMFLHLEYPLIPIRIEVKIRDCTAQDLSWPLLFRLQIMDGWDQPAKVWLQ